MSFLSDAHAVCEELDQYRSQSSDRTKPVVKQIPMRTLIDDLSLGTFAIHGGLRGGKLTEFVRTYLDSTSRLYHPGNLAHQVAVPHHAGALAALMGGFTNNPVSIYEMGPAAASIEFFVVNWLVEKVGWRPSPYPGEAIDSEAYAGGVLTHGGSLANLTALIAARSRIAPDVWQRGAPRDLALLAPAESHYSIARAAGIMGLGQSDLYQLEADEHGVVIPDKISHVLQKVREDGKRPLAVVANGCSTAMGLYDPLREIGRLCNAYGIWFHIDGAHGAAALLSNRYRGLMDGVELADSLTWDAHKLMRTPGLCTAALFRDVGTLDKAFFQDASYLFHDKVQPGFDFIHRTVECTKSALGLRFFSVLGALGEQGLAAYVDRQFDLARQAYELIGGARDFECAGPPQSNILCFRVSGCDELQLRVRDKLIAHGDFHLSAVMLQSRRFLRMVFGNPETVLGDVARLIDEIRNISSE